MPGVQNGVYRIAERGCEGQAEGAQGKGGQGFHLVGIRFHDRRGGGGGRDHRGDCVWAGAGEEAVGSNGGKGRATGARSAGGWIAGGDGGRRGVEPLGYGVGAGG